MTYAYVSRENCVSKRAYLPSDTLNGIPVAEHGDLTAWEHSEAETLRRIAEASGYQWVSARNVAELLGWGD